MQVQGYRSMRLPQQRLATPLPCRNYTNRSLLLRLRRVNNPSTAAVTQQLQRITLQWWAVALCPNV